MPNIYQYYHYNSMKQQIRFVLLCVNAILLQISLWGQSAQDVTFVGITVSNLQQSVQFYENVLNFKQTATYELNKNVAKSLFRVKSPVKVVRLQLGSETIELMEFQTKGRPIPPDSKSNDLWFQHVAIVVRDMEMAYQQLRQAKVQFVSTAPQTLPDYLPAAAGISAFYFRDPDGHNLEIIHYPPGKGNDKWQKPSDHLYLGIDHTAIGIEDTDRSFAFYQDLLGLKVAGNSVNYGSEQEHLNQVFGAHLLITGLQAQQGFGVEFLDYLAPPGGREYPAKSKPNDLWHWHTTMVVNDVQEVFTQLKERGYTIVSQGIITIPHPILGNVGAVLVRDPDGHAALVINRKNVLR
jgi:catechol 2,3-dioxygenase-like lactoylglutathione lyase family enzyme